MQSPARGGADVHPGAEPNVLDAFQDLDVGGFVLSGLARCRSLGRRACQRSSVTERGHAGPRRHVSGADGTSLEPPTFYQSRVTPKAVSGTFREPQMRLKTVALQAFAGLVPDDH